MRPCDFLILVFMRMTLNLFQSGDVMRNKLNLYLMTRGLSVEFDNIASGFVAFLKDEQYGFEFDETELSCIQELTPQFQFFVQRMTPEAFGTLASRALDEHGIPAPLKTYFDMFDLQMHESITNLIMTAAEDERRFYPLIVKMIIALGYEGGLENKPNRYASRFSKITVDSIFNALRCGEDLREGEGDPMDNFFVHQANGGEFE